MGLNRENKVQQLVIGSVAGFATGYLAMKVGKKVAFLVGGSIILFQVAQIRGLTSSNWEDAQNRARSVTDSLKSTGGSWKESAKAFASKNTCFAASFVGGFLIGVSCKH